MDLFHVIDDGVVLLRSKGVYRQAKVYRRGKDVFAGVGTGFVKLHGAAGTSRPDISWLELDAAGVVVGVGSQPRYEQD
jgi:hypothetical protein